MPYYNIVRIAAALSLLLMSSGCDRKSESSAESHPQSSTPTELEATNTTIVAVTTPEPDAGADAGATVVGVSITTIVPRGHRDVVDNIASARCRREQRCNNIGFGLKYASLDACRTQVATDWRDELNRYECPGGFVQKELDECMREIENEDCRNPFDTLERMVACRSGDICLATP